MFLLLNHYKKNENKVIQKYSKLILI